MLPRETLSQHSPPLPTKNRSISIKEPRKAKATLKKNVCPFVENYYLSAQCRQVLCRCCRKSRTAGRVLKEYRLEGKRQAGKADTSVCQRLLQRQMCDADRKRETPHWRKE